MRYSKKIILHAAIYIAPQRKTSGLKGGGALLTKVNFKNGEYTSMSLRKRASGHRIVLQIGSPLCLYISL